MTAEERTAKIEAIYARIPKMKNCAGKCEDSCTVIPCSVFEKERLEAAMGKAFEPIGLPPERVRCSALTADGKCSQYELRPFICRAFGAVNHPFMKCEHGCEPERWLSSKELFDMMQEMQDLCGELIVPEVKGWHRLTEDEARSAARLFR